MYHYPSPTPPAGAPPPEPSQEESPDVSALPYASAELLRSLWQPHRGMEIALGHRERFVASLRDPRAVVLLAVVLLTVSVLAALPYGLIAPSASSGADGVPDVLRVALLYVGSVALCLPSLLVFSVFLGLPLRGSQISVLAVLLCAVAAVFSFGFFPITWFIDLTTESSFGTRLSVHRISTVLLVFGLLMGIVQLLRCVLSVRLDRHIALFGVLVAAWLLLLLGIVHRMAGVLGLW